MKRMMKKVSVLITGILLLGTLAACAKFEASPYVKAILDNSYYNDPSGIVEQGIGTEEDAAAIYEQGIQAQLDAMLTDTTISDELYEEYRQFYKDLYSSVKYTVGEATEVDENTIEVAVTYQKMNLFVNAMSAYEGMITELVTTWTETALSGGEVPSDEQMNEELFATLKSCMIDALANATYSEDASLTIRVELKDDVWTPNQEDLMNLEYSLFDLEGLYNMQ